MRTLPPITASLLVLAGATLAGTFPASISRDPLVSGTVPERLSIGIGYFETERGITFKHGSKGVLEARTMDLYAGYDLLPWMTVFGTVGATKLKGENVHDTSSRLKVSGGLGAYLWEAEVLSPGFMAGILSIKATVEAAHQESKIAMGTVEWVEAIATLPVGYEIFDRYPVSSSGIDTSLSLYVGPALSYWRGSHRWSTPVPARERFHARETLGFLAGMDLYIARQLAIGAKVLVFDELSYGANLRFHF